MKIFNLFQVYYNITEGTNYTNLVYNADEISRALITLNYKEYIFLKEKVRNIINIFQFEEEFEKDIGNLGIVIKRRKSQTTLIEGESRIPITFTYLNEKQTKPSSVQICGSFDKWQVRHPLTFDPLFNKWSITLKIKKGEHYFKYIVDGTWVISQADKILKDPSGFINNYISI